MHLNELHVSVYQSLLEFCDFVFEEAFKFNIAFLSVLCSGDLYHDLYFYTSGTYYKSQ